MLLRVYHHFINTKRNSNMFQPLKVTFRENIRYILAAWFNKMSQQL